MWGAIIGMVKGVASQISETRKVKHQVKLEEIKTKSENKRKLMEANADYDALAIQAQKHSLKDEFLLITVMSPFIATVFSAIYGMIYSIDMSAHIEGMWKAINLMPEEYMYLVGLLVISVFGLKSVFEKVLLLMSNKKK